MKTHALKLLDGYGHAIALVIVSAIAIAFAYNNQFLQDDAFISFRYAKHFAEGHGLVWYPNSKEFGYTSFLFTFLVGVLIKLGFEVPFAAYIISFPAYLGTIFGAYFLGTLISQNRWVPILATFALSVHLTFTSYATGGLETSLQAFCIIWSYYWGVSWLNNNRKPLRIGSFAALALLTRLDSALLLMPLYIFVMWHEYIKFFRVSCSLRALKADLLLALALPAFFTSALLLGCYIYYGYALPNTFYIKIDSTWHFDTGITYISNYLRSQGYVPLVLILFSFWEFRVLQERVGYSLVLLAPILVWLCYIIYIGGDFMEYRLLVPILPFYFLFVFRRILTEKGKTRTLRIILMVASILLSSFIHKKYFGNSSDSPDKFEVVAFKQLQHPLIERPNNWISAGKKLRELFYSGSNRDVKIATTAAGALPFYAGLPTIDQLGLNTRADDTWRVKFLNYPAHRTRLTEEFLRSERVNLVFDHPLYHYTTVLNCRNAPKLSFHTPVRNTPMVFIPLNKGRLLLAYYLTKHSKVEELIEQKKILSCLGYAHKPTN